MKLRSIIFVIVFVCRSLTIEDDLFGAVPLISAPDPNGIVLTYNASTGGLSINAGELLRAVEVTSAAGLFIPENVDDGAIFPPWEVVTRDRAVLLRADMTITKVNWGDILPAELLPEDLAIDLSAATSPVGSDVSLFVVPEPMTATTILAGMSGILCWSRSARAGKI